MLRLLSHQFALSPPVCMIIIMHVVIIVAYQFANSALTDYIAVAFPMIFVAIYRYTAPAAYR